MDHAGRALPVRLFVELDTAPLRGSAGHDRHHAGHLFRAHHRDLRGRPDVREPGAVGAAAHAVVAGAVRRADDHRQVRHGRVRDRVDHLRAVLRDPALLVVRADDVAGDVVQEEKRHVNLVAELDELRRLLGRLGEQRAVVAKDADRVAVDRGPAADDRRPVEGLELLEPGAVDDASDHLADVERRAQIARDEAEQFFGIEHGIIWRQAGPGAFLAPVQVVNHVPKQPDAVHLVLGEVVAQPGNAAVHVGAAQALGLRVLAGRHLDQRRPAERDHRLVPDKDVVVAHPRLVRPARGRGAEDDRHCRDAHLGELGDLVEQPSRLPEMADGPLRLRVRIVTRVAAQVGPRGLHELDVGQPVDPRDLEAAHQLLRVELVERAGANRRVVAEDHALRARDHADAQHEARADRVVRVPGREWRDLQERAVPIERVRDALAYRQLAAAPQAVHRLRSTAAGHLLEQAVYLLDLLQDVVAVLPELLRTDVDVGSESLHALSTPLTTERQEEVCVKSGDHVRSHAAL